jgi:hypothetical protein
MSFLYFLIISSCTSEIKHKPQPKPKKVRDIIIVSTKDSMIVDSHYSFEEAISGSNAPVDVLKQLVLINVKYYSTDNKIHQGQLLINKKISTDLSEVFSVILKEHFPVAKVIPIVKYNWNDNLSMLDNNTYSFCFRNTSYSKHASGMAIDINPFFNPMRWKDSLSIRPNRPYGAVYNPEKPGTFYASSPVVLEFRKHSFRWGHNFAKKYDDHHFER